ncbi:MAG TPA: orotate phosphoribosyltransferase [Gemmatimonadales bacterium]|nr:orotate phosphoribosyltransferase [Gemmatimonadales bacterium]
MSDLDRLRELLLARSVTRGDFTLSSGRKSTFYIDARRTTMSADGLTLIGSLGLERLAARGWDPGAVGGLTLGADPVAYAIATASKRRSPAPAVDAFTIRKQAKTHGTGRRIEGCFEAGLSVVVVEDVITTGGSAQEAISALSAEGAKILGVFAVVDREEGGREVLERAGHAVETLLTARQLGL